VTALLEHLGAVLLSLAAVVAMVRLAGRG